MKINYGECHCGCGEKTNIAKRSDSNKGIRKGEPWRYMAGHQRRGKTSPMKGTGADPKVRFFSFVKKTKTCWLWQGSVNKDGYAQFSLIMAKAIHSHHPIRAHRYSYELHKGKIPNRLVIDHLCRVRHCVNPDHLEAVTQKENNFRGETITSTNKRKKQCKHGHEFTKGNTYRFKKKGGSWQRQCRACKISWQRKVMST